MLLNNEHKISLDCHYKASLRCQPLHTMALAQLENTVSWSLINSSYSVVLLFISLIPNLMSVMQSKCTPS